MHASKVELCIDTIKCMLQERASEGKQIKGITKRKLCAYLSQHRLQQVYVDGDTSKTYDCELVKNLSETGKVNSRAVTLAYFQEN